MPVDAAMLEEVRAAVAAVPDKNAGPDLSPLTTIPQLLAYVGTAMRSEDIGEADAVELIVRLLDMTPHAVRAAEAALRPLGYLQVADRLRKIAGRRKYDLRPIA